MQRSRTGPHGLYRRNGWLFGVCGGLADYFGLSAGGLRLVVLLLTLFGFGTPIIIYILLIFIMRPAPRHWDVQGERVG
jgi:phage shock protein C